MASINVFYPDSGSWLIPGPTPTLDAAFVEQVARGLGLHFTPEKEPAGNVCQANAPGLRAEFRDSFAPIDLLDYLYAVLHSASYRDRYGELLKTDSPPVPCPTDTGRFWRLVELGSQLRQIHLLESPGTAQFITDYPQNGSDLVGNLTYADDRVWINATQYFSGVPTSVWEFRIGGHQPAQKWLNDRRGQTLSADDILHYQKMIAAITQTARLMEKIDAVGLD